MVTKAQYKENGRFIELYFENAPDEKTRETLKLCGWHWYGKSKCWSNFINEENREFARSLCQLYDSDDDQENKLKQLPKVCFDEVNVIVRSNSFFCNANHLLVDLAGEIDLCDKHGDIKTYVIPIVYCAFCNTSVDV